MTRTGALGLPALLALLLLVLASAPVAEGRETTPSSHFRPGSQAAPQAGTTRVRLPQGSLTLDSRDRVRTRLRCRPRPCSGRVQLRSVRSHDGKRAALGGTGFALKGKRGSVLLRLSKPFAQKVRARGGARALLLAKAVEQRRPTRREVRISVPRGPRPAPVPAPAPASAPPPAPAPGPHRIKATAAYLYDSVTGARFVPRGANYTRLSQTPAGVVYHSTFEPGRYDPAVAATVLDGMRAAGYNTVRVMIDPGSTKAAEAHGIGRGMGTWDLLYAPYMEDFANFVALAAARGIYVVPSLDVFPQNSYYWGIVGAWVKDHGTPNMDGRNLSYLEPGHVAAKAEYMKQFAAALGARLGPLASAILAYQADNELYFDASQPPYDKMTGTVTPLNGVTYDMSNPAQRQQSADASLVEYSYRVKRALATVDPEALLTIGFFTNRAVGKTGYDGFATYCSTSCTPGVDYRVPGRPASLSIFGAADFLDVHLYASTSYTSSADLESVEYKQFRRPWIIGEIGTQKSVYGNDVARAADGMRGYQVATCRLGAQGWLYWTWDTHEDLASQPLFFHLDDGGGAINRQLAPAARPDPCRP